MTQQQAEAGARLIRQQFVDEKDALSEELDNVIQEAREGLTPIPQPGEAWDAKKNHTTGDTVTDGGLLYVALRYSKGKRPSEHPEVWEVKAAPTLPAWSSIPDGTIIYSGDEVTHGGKNWRCAMQHTKSTVYTPKAGSSRWTEI